jgi:hypothetical protein
MTRIKKGQVWNTHKTGETITILSNPDTNGWFRYRCVGHFKDFTASYNVRDTLIGFKNMKLVKDVPDKKKRISMSV